MKEIFNIISEKELEKSNLSIVVSNKAELKLEENLLKTVKNSKTNRVINTLGLEEFENIHVLVKDCPCKIRDLLVNIKEDVVIYVDTFDFDNETIEKFITATIENRYVFDKYKEIKRNENKIYLYSKQDLSAVINKAAAYAKGANSCKDLINTPHLDMNAEHLATYATKLSKELSMECNIYDKEWIENKKMGAYLSVNRGSFVPPKFIVIKYNGDKSSEEYTALVGKGVMYDTGGYSIKGKGFMPNMKSDMGGSATVLGAIETIATLKLEKNVMVVIAATDNAINAKATYPDDVVTSMSGKTIEINNTDAEGRLTLCDALTYTQEVGVTKIIDVATLTGGVVTALGSSIAGVYTNDDKFLTELKNTCELTKEDIWELPVKHKYFEKGVKKSKIADLHNSPGGQGHSSYAARFLYEFINKGTSWIHIDIAGVAFRNTMATGQMTKSLAKLFELI